MSGRGGIYEGPDGSKLHGDGREVKAMSQTDKERVIAELADIYEIATPKKNAMLILADKAFDAGYTAAKEDAAQAVCVHCMSKPSVAENGTFVHLDIKGRIECKAAAIRKLETK